MQSNPFRTGLVVWALLPDRPWWPAIVADTPKANPDTAVVDLVGEAVRATVQTKDIAEYRANYVHHAKTQHLGLKRAIQAANRILNGLGKGQQSNNNLDFGGTEKPSPKEEPQPAGKRTEKARRKKRPAAAAAAAVVAVVAPLSHPAAPEEAAEKEDAAEEIVQGKPVVLSEETIAVLGKCKILACYLRSLVAKNYSAEDLVGGRRLGLVARRLKRICESAAALRPLARLADRALLKMRHDITTICFGSPKDDLDPVKNVGEGPAEHKDDDAKAALDYCKELAAFVEKVQRCSCRVEAGNAGKGRDTGDRAADRRGGPVF